MVASEVHTLLVVCRTGDGGARTSVRERARGVLVRVHEEAPFVQPVIRIAPILVAALVLAHGTVSAQGVDLTVFLGRAYPIYDDRLTLRPSVPSLPGVDISVAGTPEIRADGGPVFGGALAFEFGVFGIEGRLDATNVGFELEGARYDLQATQPPFQGLQASVSIEDGRFDTDTLYLLSINARLRTPGPVGIVASGGLSYLPDFSITGTAPLSVQLSGIPIALGVSPRLRLQASPGQSEHSFGVNGGAGLRIGAGRIAFMAEVRAFYFREYELRFGVEDAPEIIGDLLDSIAPIRFEPVILNAQAGIVLKF